MAVAIDFKGVNKWFAEHHVLTDVDLSVDAGEVIVVCGPSGSGKSTLIRCVNRLEPIQQGQITVHGEPITGSGVNLVKLRTDVGMVFQSFNLFPHMTVLQNIMLAPLKVKGMRADEAEKVARGLLQRVRIPDRADYYPANLSGGQQQRVAIARALAMRPKVLLLDEITSALDPELVGEVEDVIRSLLSERIMMVIVTHALRFAREVAHRIAYLSEGAIVELGSPAEVLDRPKDPSLKEFLRHVR
jgi:polar amino acid transport system ATP-binding protein